MAAPVGQPVDETLEAAHDVIHDMHAGAWTPTVREGESLEDMPLNEVVAQALGSASMCWVGGTGSLQFDSVKASWVLDGLMAHLNHVIDDVIAGTSKAVRGETVVATLNTKFETVPCLGDCTEEGPHDAHFTPETVRALREGPQLGMATTREMMAELAARFESTGRPRWGLTSLLRSLVANLPASELDYRTVDGG